LSIDAQRLELADVLTSDGGMEAVDPLKAVQDDQSGGFSWRKVLKARTAKSASLVLVSSPPYSGPTLIQNTDALLNWITVLFDRGTPIS
jgi:hypothetical protein